MARTWAVLRALLTKNWSLKARHPAATWSELANPLLCILLFALLKTMDTDLRMPAGWTTGAANASAPSVGARSSLFAQSGLLSDLNSSLSSVGMSATELFGTSDAAGSGSSSDPASSPAMLLRLASALKMPKFYFTETTMQGLLVSLALQAFMEGDHLTELSKDDMLGCALKFALLGYTGQVGVSTYAVPVECRGRIIPYRIAITPDTAFTREYFSATMEQWHPRLPLTPSIYGISVLTTPSFCDSRVFFDNESALEEYMATEDYGTSSKKPKIYAAIAFEQFPEGDDIGGTRGHPIVYSLRFNATHASSGFPSSVPHTRRSSRFASSTRKLVDTSSTLSYSTRGFMTLQTAVARFLNCIPDWDAVSKSTSGECQVHQAVSDSSDVDQDERLMGQIESDMILSSAFNVIRTMEDLLPESLRADGSGLDGGLNVSAATIPHSSKLQLLQSLRIAPQAYIGASVFVAPKPAFRYAPFYDKVSVVFPVGFVLSYLYTVSRMVVAFLTEKETRSRELMRIFGVSDALLFTSWLLSYVVLLALATALQTVGARALLFPNSSALLLFGFFFSFALSSFAFAFLVSAFFSRARSGSFVGMALFFMLFFVYFSFGEETGEAQRTWAALLSPVALAQGINILAKLEAVGVGASHATAGELIDGFRFESAIYMQLVDFALYVMVAAYVQQVVPQEFGVPEKWYFLASPSYWRRSQWCSARLASLWSPSGSKVASDGVVDLSPRYSTIEPVGEDLQRQEREARAVVIMGLSKQYNARGGGGGVKIAVNNLDLTLYEGHVTCLLGHNGAGKSTLISMLTGMTAPSSGDAIIRGHSISTSMPRVRESLGYCPQASVLYPELTVEEHLRLYGCIKGLTLGPDLDKEVDTKVSEVGLEAKRCTQAYALSGGMQRRLSLAIAFLGDSKVVFLDEPTSGMDPYSRRSTWELIRSSRRGRVVVLTTHFMDEADVLGDRIAIVANGVLQCVGSSLFLKNHFGVGYRLSITLATTDTTERTGLDAQDGSVISLVRSHVPSVVVATSAGTELTLQLPFESAPAFSGLFRAIDSSCAALGVQSYAISVTTLEEVFLKVLDGGQGLNGTAVVKTKDTTDDGTVSNAGKTSAQVEVAVLETNELDNRSWVGIPMKMMTSVDQSLGTERQRHPQYARRSILSQFVALVRKRVRYGKRDRNMLLFRTLLPIVVIFTGLAALRQSMFLKNDPKKLLETASEYLVGRHTPIPVSFPGEVLSSSAFGDVLTTSKFNKGELFEVPIPHVVYDGSEMPTVFGVTYSPSEFQPDDTGGYCLRFSELVFESGYGEKAPDTTPSNDDEPIQTVDGQHGGYLVYGSTEDHVLAYNVLVNTSSVHAAPIYKAMMDEAIHKHLLVAHAAGSGNPLTQEEIDRVSIRVSSHPLPLSFKMRTLFSSFLSLPAVIFVIIAFTFIPASVMPFLVREKQDGQNAKYQQLLSGVSLPAYWLANLAFDLAVYVIPMVAAILLLRGFGVSSSLSRGGAACATCTQDVPCALVTLFALFGIAIAPWTYLLSHYMRDPRACLLYTIMLNFLLGIVLILISYTMGTLASTKPANDSLVYVWRLSPLFSLGNGLLSIIVGDIKALYGLSGRVVSAFDADIAGTDIAYLAVEGPVYFLLTVLVDEYRNRTSRHDSRMLGGSFSWIGHCFFVALARFGIQRDTNTDDQQVTESTVSVSNDVDEKEDEDIAAEARRLMSEPKAADSEKPLLSQPVKVVGLRKRYLNGKLAVRNLSFGLDAGECFGFLGINGAGKTTTMRILTGDLTPTAGSASLNGFDILTQRCDARRSIGYCPQFDALLDLLTVREHLELYAQLKGLASATTGAIARLLQKLHLEPFEHKLAGTLSGGNKRKLSVAIALLGDPTVIFLDEPSTGMDPASRRLLWDVILDVSVRSKPSAVVLTTHSMDECEALCSKAGIMVDGRLQCLGSISHLKSRFGDGFLLDCKLRPASADEVKQLQLDRLAAFESDIDVSKVSEVCSALGSIDRAKAFMASIAPSPSLSKERLGVGRISALHLCAWWIMEDRMVALTAFLHRRAACRVEAGDSDGSRANDRDVVVLERQGDYCRFRVAATVASGAPETSLADMFELVEGAKAELAILEYSISHTSLEQIFNNFARQQQQLNEKSEQRNDS